MSAASSAPGPLRIGRYVLHGEIASGGMGTVHYGRLVGAVGFARPVAIKRLRRDLVGDTEVRTMFIDEARVASHVRHPNVVQTLDCISQDDELFLVMDYIEGESLSRLLQSARKDKVDIPVRIAKAILCDTLNGLHAAHEAKDGRGDPLEIVHRDVSPQNILVGTDGASRVADFGVAKAAGRLQVTRDGAQKGKPAYMAPEQLQSAPIDRRADIYAAGVVLWELLTGRRLFKVENDVALVKSILKGDIAPPSATRGAEAVCLDDVVARALSLRRTERFATASQMAVAIREAPGGVATAAEVGAWVTELAGERVAERAREVADFDATLTASTLVPQASPVTADTPRSGSRFFSGAAFGAAAVAIVVGGFLYAGRTPPVTAEPVTTPSAEPHAEDPPVDEAPSDSASTPPSPSPSPHRRTPRTVAPSKKALGSPSGKCVVRSFVDDGGVKHFFEDCPK